MVNKQEIMRLMEAFRAANAWAKSEEDVQSGFTLELLRVLGWSPANWRVNTPTEVRTGKKPDIVLTDDTGFTVLVIESKKASDKSRLDNADVEQLYRYCRAEGRYWGILTNFVEWRIYAVHPKRLYRRFAFRDLLWPGADPALYIDLLSGDGMAFLAAIARGALCERRGRFSDDAVYYPEQEEIKREFFERLRGWRKNLRAYLFREYGAQQGADEVDIATQRLLDRLIFMEVCADKEVLPSNVLRAVFAAPRGFYREVCREFRRMDDLFDSELFAPHWIDEADVDDGILEPIVRGIAEVDFRILPAHVIGEVYEDYLGELLREGKRGVWAQAAAEQATRRKRGVYYTPDYIVDYIVNHTVGELLAAAKTEEDVRRIKVLDPACGSGSFLIRAFDEFARAYARVLAGGTADGLFGFDIKRAILENNIYGVDIDPRAVEIAKLNLIIKALEGTRYQDLKGRKLLPNLSLNIRCGNSLVGGEVLNGVAHHTKPNGRIVGPTLFTPRWEDELAALEASRRRFYASRDDAETEALLRDVFGREEKVNLALNDGLAPYESGLAGERPFFNFAVAFPEVLAAGGFDAVIGNPPYVRQERLADYKPYLGAAYESWRGTADLYVPFVERALELTRPGGRFGFIVSNKWLRARYGDGLRKYIKQFDLEQLVDFGELKVFADAATFPLIVVVGKPAEKKRRTKPVYAAIKKLEFTSLEGEVKQLGIKLDAASLADEGFSLVRSDVQKVIAKMKRGGMPLGEYVGGKIYRGVLTGFNEAFVINKETRDNLVRWDRKSARIIKPFIVGDDVRSYYIDHKERYLIFTQRNIDIKRFPAVAEYLEQWKKELTPKRSAKQKIGRKPGNYAWYEIQDTVDYWCEFEKPKIVFPDIAKESRFAYEPDKVYTDCTLFIIPKKDFYLLGLLNSRLIWLYLKATCYALGDPEKKGRLRLKRQWVERLPLPAIDLKDNNSFNASIKVANYARSLLELTATERSRLTNVNKIKGHRAAVDDLVYELYGLTKDEIKIVERS